MSLIDRLVVDRPEEGVFKVHRDLFASPRLFELEMEHIFEKSWVYVGFEGQVAEPDGYFASWIGRQPILVTRGEDGELRAFLNSCRHKGARLTVRECGSARRFVCPYHSWTYSSDGRLVSVKDKSTGFLPPQFDEQDFDLKPVAKLGSYRGLIFASLSRDVPPLEEHLGGARDMIDLVMDQGEQGMELVPGRTVYTYGANWKMQVENGMDPYHLTSAHQSFMQIVTRRNARQSELAKIRSRDFTRSVGAEAGALQFEYGHGAVWITNVTPEQKPIHDDIDALVARVGETRARWMLNFRNLVLFPNVQLADSESLILRVIRPISVDKTEMRLFSLAPIGEPAESRSLRIRQHEDFFNVSGLATPDDTAIYEECQAGLNATGAGYQRGYDRGATLIGQGPDAAMREIGVAADWSLTGPFKLQSEMQYQPIYREWKRLMAPALAGVSA